MFTQPRDARHHAQWCWGASSLSILLTGLCTMLVTCALPTPAQAQVDQTSVTVPFRHFSSDSAVLQGLSPEIAAAFVTNAYDPVPIAGGLAPGVHIFAPGPTSQGNQGLDVEPNGITNFSGFSALAYLSGTATDTNNNKYNLSSDMRLYRGDYVSADGKLHRGTFVFIWIDLYDPSSGTQVHDFNGHVSQSGLFWIVQVSDDAFTVNGQSVHLHLTEAAVIDNLRIFGPGRKYSNATVDITWTPTGKVRRYRPGSTNPTDPTFFSGAFRNAIAKANFTVLLDGVTFTVNGANSRGAFAEMGNEQNGRYLDP